MKKAKVYVMLSGGVDSSVAALLLKKRGFEVTGVYFKRFKPDGNTDICKADGLSAQKVAEQLDIEFKVWDFEKDYKNKVFKYFVDSYNKGETPNPDIICNKEIKFGIFYERAKKDGADFVASGHYVRLYVRPKYLKKFCLPKELADYLHLPYEQVLLKEARDKQKDQSYFLSQINPGVLKSVIFPLGNLKKNKVRQIAKRYGLHTADRKDSQGICFIGKEINLKDFLSKYIVFKNGDLLTQTGKVIGLHKSAKLYTRGERRGFYIFPKKQTPDMNALYVLYKDLTKNTITVGNRKELDAFNQAVNSILLTDLQIYDKIAKSKLYYMRIRHRGAKSRVKIRKFSNKEIELEILEPAFAPSEGQFASIYDKGACLLLSGKISKIYLKNTEKDLL